MKTRLHAEESPSAEVIELFERRAARLSTPTADEESVDMVWVAEFPVGEESFALRVETLSAALPLRLVTPVPLAPPEVVGVFRHEGEMLPVFSLASLLGVRGWRQDPAVLLVLELSQGRRVAVDCEQVPKPMAIPASVFAGAMMSDAEAVTLIIANGRPLSIVNANRLFEGSSR
jgi:chemotaxis signal transduction protein